MADYFSLPLYGIIDAIHFNGGAFNVEAVVIKVTSPRPANMKLAVAQWINLYLVILGIVMLVAVKIRSRVIG